MFTKILFTAAIIAAVLYSVRALGFLKGAARRHQTRPETEKNGAANPELTAEDMTKCAECGVYVPRHDPAPCDRPDCPYT